ncbi:DUF6194 family protein [Cryptosporangium phraense]|uniref:Erythromycin esterase family protein n=1 Tax=Cryptosporangium phraense TaxID=2593070 RepID=A0A545AM17_9ACTN|nr:DUF6194 family protein [Cryptosporangium phraense]TQS42364.1 erythromycin esterase family protein [Cryptosporangium phraense]
MDTLLSSSPELVALGEPTHGEQEFLRRRNALFADLVENHGFRSIAIESDRVAGLAVDDYVRGGAGTLESAMETGFTHNFGRFAANRELVEWMRDHPEPLAFHGFDAPTENTEAPSPRRFLTAVCEYVAPSAWAEIDDLLGDDEPWDEVLEAERSIGGSPRAVALRGRAEDLLSMLYERAPGLVAGSSLAVWRRMEVLAKAAVGMLRYHAEVARPGPDRIARLLSVRDAWMARNLLDIRLIEADRGPTLVFANNRHVQKYPGRIDVGGTEAEWAGAGAILSTLLGSRYVVITGSLGESGVAEVRAPAAGTYEAELADGLTVRPVLDAVQRADGSYRYFPLAAEDLATTDAVLHVAHGTAVAAPLPVGDLPVGPSADELAEWIGSLPGVGTVVATEEMGAPQNNWGNSFFSMTGDEYHPFATIVLQDMAGFDEESALGRAGVYRVNVHAGRDAFGALFGFAPRELAERRGEFDYSALDVLLPHPVYGAQGWVCVLNPSAERMPAVMKLVGDARHAAAARTARRAEAGPPAGSGGVTG